MPIVTIPAVLLGLAVGSFLNVVWYRTRQGISLMYPPSQCPCCSHPIRWRHNVPVLGWIMLRGRCFDCRSPINPRYPIVEALTGLLFGTIAAQIASREFSPAAAGLLAAGVALALLVKRRRPRRQVARRRSLTSTTHDAERSRRMEAHR